MSEYKRLEEAIESIQRQYKFGIDYSSGKDMTAICLVGDQAEAVIKALSEYKDLAKAEDRWIPVSERLPEEKYADEAGYVLCCHAYDPKWASKYTCHWSVVPENVRLGNTTHWRPLPEPPKSALQQIGGK